MQHSNAFYIDGRRVTPDQLREFPVINPATERPLATLVLGNATYVNKAVAAAYRAFLTWSVVTVDERLALLRRILALYEQRYDGFAEAIYAWKWVYSEPFLMWDRRRARPRI